MSDSERDRERGKEREKGNLRGVSTHTRKTLAPREIGFCAKEAHPRAGRMENPEVCIQNFRSARSEFSVFGARVQNFRFSERAFMTTSGEAPGSSNPHLRPSKVFPPLFAHCGSLQWPPLRYGKGVNAVRTLEDA